MNHAELIDELGGTTTVARLLGIKPPSVHEWRSKGIPSDRLIQLGAEIEGKAGIPRWDLRPDDWHRIWPELIGADGAPAVPTPTPEPAKAAA